MKDRFDRGSSRFLAVSEILDIFATFMYLAEETHVHREGGGEREKERERYFNRYTSSRLF